ncbi:hypothetical protein [Paraburkholderia youngii]|uniref:hypothetical protein n=1 Tax=Paraburkholderia youngii TaxID=2782701 RepID=UPI003D192A5A
MQAAGILSEQESGFIATIELRGQADVSDELAAADAANLLRFLASERVLTDEALPTLRMANQSAKVFPLDGASHLPCPCAGVIVYRKAPGDQVSVGEVIAEVVPLDGRGFNQRVPIISIVDGLMIVRQLKKLVRPGKRAALLAGKRPVRDRHAGSLLTRFLSVAGSRRLGRHPQWNKRSHTMKTRHVTLESPGAGTELDLCHHTFGPPSGRKALYIQATLHAGEVPGLLVLQHLLAVLTRLEQEGKLLHQVTISPWANPVGMNHACDGPPQR